MAPPPLGPRVPRYHAGMRSASGLVLVLVLGCGGTTASAPPDGQSNLPDAGLPDTGPDAATGDAPALDAPATAEPGSPVFQPALRGRGPCEGKTLGEVIAAVRQLMPALANITIIE